MHPQLLTRVQATDVVQPRDSLEASLHSLSNELSFFYTTVEEKLSNIPQPSWEASLNRKVAIALDTGSQSQGEDFSAGISKKSRKVDASATNLRVL